MSSPPVLGIVHAALFMWQKSPCPYIWCYEAREHVPYDPCFSGLLDASLAAQPWGTPSRAWRTAGPAGFECGPSPRRLQQRLLPVVGFALRRADMQACEAFRGERPCCHPTGVWSLGAPCLSQAVSSHVCGTSEPTRVVSPPCSFPLCLDPSPVNVTSYPALAVPLSGSARRPDVYSTTHVSGPNRLGTGLPLSRGQLPSAHALCDHVQLQKLIRRRAHTPSSHQKLKDGASLSKESGRRLSMVSARFRSLIFELRRPLSYTGGDLPPV